MLPIGRYLVVLIHNNTNIFKDLVQIIPCCGAQTKYKINFKLKKRKYTQGVPNNVTKSCR